MADSVPELCGKVLKYLDQAEFKPVTSKERINDASIDSWSYEEHQEEIQSFTEEKVKEKVILKETEIWQTITQEEEFSNLYDDLVARCSEQSSESKSANLVLNALKEYLSQRDRTNKDALRTRISSDLKEAVSREKIDYKIKFMLHGVKAENKTAINSWEIRPPTNKEIAQHLINGNLQNSPGAVIVIEDRFKPDKVIKNPPVEEVEEKLRALSLLEVSHPKIAVVSIKSKNKVLKGTQEYLNESKSDFTVKIDEEHEDGLSRITEVFEKIEKDSFVDIAQSRYERATSNERSDVNQLLDAVIGLDAIYTTRKESELADKVRHRCALVTGLMGKNPKKVRNQVRGAYDKRSKLFHGSKPEKPSEQEKKLLLDSLRKSILAFSQMTEEKDKEDIFSYIDKSFISKKERKKFEKFILKNMDSKFLDNGKMLTEANK